MAQDEGRFGRISSPKRAWAPPGMRPKAPKQVIRAFSSVYAAVAPEQGLMTSLILPSADTAMMNIFLAHVAEVFADYFLVMQVDQAGWHRAKELHIPENIRLIFQPAYSPEVNPVEHLWEELREKYLHNRIFPSLEDLIDVLCQALSDLTEDTERLRSMMFFPHFRMES
jgi:putative transposase